MKVVAMLNVAAGQLAYEGIAGSTVECTAEFHPSRVLDNSDRGELHAKNLVTSGYGSRHVAGAAVIQNANAKQDVDKCRNGGADRYARNRAYNK